MASSPGSTFDPLATTGRPSRLDDAVERLSAGWMAGRRPRAEEFADWLDTDDAEGLVELIYHEYCLAELAGLKPDPADYRARFPALSGRLERLFGLHGAIDDDALRSWTEPDASALPESGDEIGPYRLLRELGRGGLARVFLAEQSDLEDRLVVLKVASRPSAEAALQARVRHPHIVEVLARAETGDGRLHLIAMPFLGGATLGAILARGPWRSGRDLLAALESVGAPELPPDASRGAERDLLARASRAEAACWIVARLAEALAHAARRGVTHGDIKPANILIAADARPMLLDFNLAADWRGPGSFRGAPLGGTLAYMAPERLRALADPKSAPAPRASDRQKADLYALGLVLRELLTGRRPVAPTSPPTDPRGAAQAMEAARLAAEVSPRKAMRGVPSGLRPILGRCLADDPADRYSGAAELAEDLDAWRKGRTPRHAPQTAHAGASRWIERHRRGLITAVLVALGVGAAGIAAYSAMTTRLRHQAEAKLAALWDAGDPSTFRARRFGAWTIDDESAVAAARRDLDRYGVLGRGDWRSRDDVRWLAPDDRDDLEMWLLERAWRLASALAARPDSPEDWTRALALLDSDPLWASLRAFDGLRATLRERLGRAHDAAPDRGRPPAWLVAYARALAAEEGDPGLASGAIGDVLRDRPSGFWPHYRASGLAARRSDYVQAVRHLAACRSLRPGNAVIGIRIASCLLAAGDPSAAKAECDRALELDPEQRDAYLIRALSRAQLGQPDVAQGDLDRFASLSRDRPGEAWAAREILAERSPGAPRRDPGSAALAEAAQVQGYLAAYLERAGRVEEALAAYDRAIALDPEHLRARVGRANLLRIQRRNEGRSEMADLAAHPRIEELMRQQPRTLNVYLFVVQDRLRGGDLEGARALAERALDLAMQLDPDRPEVAHARAEARYAMARTLARTRAGDPASVRRAASLLKEAAQFDPGYIARQFDRDPQFDPARAAIADQLR